MTISNPIQPTLQKPVPPDLRTLLTSLGFEIKKQINCIRIGNIQSFNAANQTAVVQIAQQQITSISPVGVATLQPFAPLLSVPVYFPSGGGYTLTFPIAAGDECIVLFNDRELDNWKLQGGVNSYPSTPRIHDLADGVCLVGFRSFPRSLGSVSTDTTQLRSDDGTTYVEVAGGGIVNVVAPTSINLNSPIVNIEGVINVHNVNSATNSCNITGTIVASGDVQSNSGGHKLNTHVHSGVQTGGGDTGGPVG